MNGSLEFNGLTFARDGDSLNVTHMGVSGARYTLDQDDLKSLVNYICPERVMTDDRRMDFRIAVTALSGLSASLRKDGTEIRVVPANISFTGIFVKFAGEILPGLSTDTAVEVMLDYDGETSVHAGIIKRSIDHGLGIFFTESIQNELLEPPLPLVRIITGLQKNRANQA